MSTDSDHLRGLRIVKQLALELLKLPIPDVGRVRMKPDGTRQTDGDLHYHQHIAAYMSAALPACLLVSEEDFIPGSYPEQGWFALFDPLDGTENFFDGRPEWGIGLSLWFDGRHSASMIVLPTIAKHLVSGDQVPTYSSQILAVSDGFRRSEDTGEFRGHRITGSACWNAYHTICGSFAEFRSTPMLRAWEVQAGLCLAVEANCEVTVEGRGYDMKPIPLSERVAVAIAAPGRCPT